MFAQTEMPLSDSMERDYFARFTNEGGYLLDPPGARRYLSVAVAVLAAAAMIFALA